MINATSLAALGRLLASFALAAPMASGSFARIGVTCGHVPVPLAATTVTSVLDFDASGSVTLETRDARGCRRLRFGHYATEAHILHMAFTSGCGTCATERFAELVETNDGFGLIEDRLILSRRTNAFARRACPPFLALRRTYRRTRTEPRSTSDLRREICGDPH